jgi:hypothetical protein
MLAAHRDELLQRVPDDATVLDVGGWAVPLERADWVIDLMPFETRGAWGASDPARERFTAQTWVQRDICDRDPWPFADGQFDFVVCAHTLEDLRDPVWVCSELNRVARAGYVEFPARIAEQSWHLEGPWSGWNHHRWLCEADRAAGSVRFTFKYDMVHLPEYRFPRWFFDGLSDEQKVDWLWWEGSFAFAERIHMDPAELHAEMAAFAAAHRGTVPRPPLWRRLRS